MILRDFTVGSLEVRAYLVGCPDTGDAFIVDPAGSVEELNKEAGRLGLTIKLIVNTHGHPDHTCGNAAMKDITGAPVVMHRDDDEFFRRPEVVSTFLAWGFEAAPPADIHFGDTLEIGSLKFDVIHTPGHSPGSVCIFGNGIVITGDTLFIDGIGRTDLPGGSYDTLMKSLREKVITLPDETRVLPGHHYGPSPVATIGEQKRTNPYLSM
jgi:glyoxylase-like metal-dependent hydrolase (beta-lactamase superfamily II)